MPSTKIPYGGDPNHQSETTLQTLGHEALVKPTGAAVHKSPQPRHELALPEEKLEATKASSPASIERVHHTAYRSQLVISELEEDWGDLIEEITSDMDLGSDHGSDAGSDPNAEAHATDAASIASPTFFYTRILPPAPDAGPIVSSSTDAGPSVPPAPEAGPIASPTSVAGLVAAPPSVNGPIPSLKAPEGVTKQRDTLFTNSEIKETFEDSIRKTLNAEQFEAVLSYLTGTAALDDASPHAKLVRQLVEEIDESHQNVGFPSLEEIYGKQPPITQAEAKITAEPAQELSTTSNVEKQQADAHQAKATPTSATHVVMDIKYWKADADTKVLPWLEKF
jgi:hypothetical protein